MNTLIFRTAAPVIVLVMLVFSVFVLWRGHNEPGGGFIGGLIAACAMAIYAMALGVPAAKKAMRWDGLGFAGLGVLVTAASGLLSLPAMAPYLTGMWTAIGPLALGTPMLFDVGVYLAVFGALATVILGLIEGEGE